ncbi:MAG: shikimate dehydrogenase [Phycisphaerae bacterium]
MTYLAVPVFGDSIEDVRRDITTAVDLGADLIELRLDRMPDVSDEDLRRLAEKPAADVPMILTLRSVAEGGDCEASDEERIDRLADLGPLFDYIDLEFTTWLSEHDLRRRLRRALVRAEKAWPKEGQAARRPAPKCRLILSKHDFTGRPDTLMRDQCDLLGTHECSVPKLAWRARTIRDNFEAFEWMQSWNLMSLPDRDISGGIAICMGPEGLLSRVLAKRFGAFAAFASLRPGLESAPGQITVTELKQCYRWDAINEDTTVYGVIGDPVDHSLSPRVHNAAFEEAGTNAVYLPLKVTASYEAFTAFMVQVMTDGSAYFRGFSVTIPHKEHAVTFIERVGGTIDKTAARVGAVNTITFDGDVDFERDLGFHGYNTDYQAVIDTLESGLGRSASQFSDLTVSVLGAGGIARSVVAALTDRGASVTIFNRTDSRAVALADEFGCRQRPWDRRGEGSPDLIVNCTPVGMGPETDASPLDETRLKPGQTVFDTIYNPLQTKLLRAAEERGARVIDGLTLFAHQARAQFRIWTGIDLPVAFFRSQAQLGLAAM